MANIASAEKQRRQAEKRKARNRAGKSNLRSALKKARTAITGGDADKDVLATGFSAIDKAAKRGLIKDNTADRYKSRLAGASKRTASSK
ncbi:MAG: 30S ribosomal protein S20 [Acidobacteria bacterium]|nr:30S ribosomal protein S20 [Acidobacteriota bacterium]MBV9478630.1 30S ribosomal protein S20 [Acidobacteriota bacterium]